ncbi:TylF/MycF/NovP-related O-methyltransferase [Candidatus Ponderosibacter sp. Uisw_141_02]|uniref:TylF/MycF/NovP-related O-methyltransferase n=1 Tax=Candidatus Ponderosibacter sp. Uisw_141_02 TaxID=3231000 RepID=UPI003D57BE91
MKKLVKRNIVKFVQSLGYTIQPILTQHHNIAVELDDNDVDLIKYVLDSGYTMTSVLRLVNTLKSCRYVVENKIPGDFVEAGVWRGGNGILAKKLFDELDSQRHVWMFDTFEGMTEPTEFDVAAKSKKHALGKYKRRQLDTHNEWCFASLEDVQDNCRKSGLRVEDFKFIKGDVNKTLLEKQNLPREISVLRLDTDWYESTKTELEILYPVLSVGGVLIIDDYGHWEGARKAVDEYFSTMEYKPLFNVTDYTGRSAIKM